MFTKIQEYLNCTKESAVMGNTCAFNLWMGETGIKRRIMRDTMMVVNEILQFRHDGFRLGLTFKHRVSYAG